MLDISLGEMLLISTVALVVLGPERLPKTARWAGRTLATWRNLIQRAKHDIGREFQWDEMKNFGQHIENTWAHSMNTLHSTLNTPVNENNNNISTSYNPSSSQDTLHQDTAPMNTLDTSELSTSQSPGVTPWIGVVMGSSSDWKVMKHAVRILKEFNIPFEAKVVSAHRMPDAMFIYAATARQRGIKAIIAGAGGAAHLPGMLAAKTTVPVLGVPIPATLLNGQDALYSIVQMPKGIPVATFAIGESGAANAALFAVSLLSNQSLELTERLEAFRLQQTATASQSTLDIENLE